MQPLLPFLIHLTNQSMRESLYIFLSRVLYGEDVFKFHGHGGPLVVDNLIQRVQLGAR